MYKTMTDDLFQERLMTRLAAMEAILNHNVTRDFDVTVVLKNTTGTVIGALSLDIYSPTKMHNIILYHSHGGELETLSIVFHRKHAGVSTVTGTADFDLMDICRRYDYKDIIRSQIKDRLEKCNRSFYGF